jgi:hypothetical protein
MSLSAKRIPFRWGMRQHFPGSCSGLRPVNDDEVFRLHALQHAHATSLPPELICLLSTKNVLLGDKSNCFLYEKLNAKNRGGAITKEPA